MIILPFNYGQYFLRLFILFSSELGFSFLHALRFYIHSDFQINAFIFLAVFPSVVQG